MYPYSSKGEMSAMQLPPLSRSPFRRQPADMLERFNDWQDTQAGQAVLDAERAIVAEWTPRLVGQRAVEDSGGGCQDMRRDAGAVYTSDAAAEE